MIGENGEFWLMEGERKAFGINKHKSGRLCLGFGHVFACGDLIFSKKMVRKVMERGEKRVD